MQMPSLPSPNDADYSAIVHAEIVTGVDNDGSVFTGLSWSNGMMPSNNPKPSSMNPVKINSTQAKWNTHSKEFMLKRIFSYSHFHPLILFYHKFHLTSISMVKLFLSLKKEHRITDCCGTPQHSLSQLKNLTCAIWYVRTTRTTCFFIEWPDLCLMNITLVVQMVFYELGRNQRKNTRNISNI